MNSSSCLADYFTWPQVALTHHVNLSRHIEPPALQTVKQLFRVQALACAQSSNLKVEL
jgi:hypothetical protein